MKSSTTLGVRHVLFAIGGLVPLVAACGGADDGTGPDPAGTQEQLSEVVQDRDSLPANLKIAGLLGLTRFDAYEDDFSFIDNSGFGQFFDPPVPVPESEHDVRGCRLDTALLDPNSDVGSEIGLIPRTRGLSELSVPQLANEGLYNDLFNDEEVPAGSTWDVDFSLAPWSANPDEGQRFARVLRTPARFDITTPELVTPTSTVILTRGKSFEVNWEASRDVDFVNVWLSSLDTDAFWVCGASASRNRFVIPANVIDSIGGAANLFVFGRHREVRKVGRNTALLFVAARGASYYTEVRP